MRRRGVALASVILAIALLWALAIGVAVMSADGQRQYQNLLASTRALYVAEAGLEWAIKTGQTTTTDIAFGGGVFSVSKSGVVADVAAESASGTPTVELYVATGQWSVTGRVGSARRVIQEGGNAPRANTASLATDGAASAVAAGDLDGDGDIDLVFGTTTGKAQVFLNDGTGAFTQVGSNSANSEIAALALADMDGDGDLDIVCVDRGTAPYQLEIWVNVGGGSFKNDVSYSLGGKALALSLKDVHEDANGDIDVVVSTEADQFEVWTNSGAGVLTLGTAYAVNDASAPNGIVLSDVDQDGDNDVMLVTQGKKLEKWLNNGSGVFAYSASNTLNQPGKCITAGNFNGASGEDMLVGETVHRFETFVNNGTGTFTQDQRSTTPPGDVYAVALFDMDGDGDLDAVLGEVDTDGIEIWANNGTGTFTLQSAFTTSGDTKAVVAADFNYAQ